MLKILLVFIVLSHSVANAQNPEGPNELRIDPTNIVSLNASDVFDEIRYIPLETTDESVIGTITQLFVTEDFYIVFDRSFNKIVVFRKNGKHYSTIQRDDKSNYPIYLDVDSEEIIWRQRRTFVRYALDGTRRPDTQELRPGEPYFLKGNFSLYYDYRVSAEYLPDSLSYELYIFEGQNKIVEAFPYNMKTSAIETYDWIFVDHSNFYESGTDSTVLFSHPYDYSIYEITTKDVAKLHTFVLPLEFTYNSDFLLDPKYQRGDRKRYFDKNTRKVDRITFPYQFGSTLFFKLNDRNSVVSDSYIYSIFSGSLTRIKDIVSDEKSFFLPFTDFGLGNEFINRNFLTRDKTSLYTCISSAFLIRAYSDLKSKRLDFDELLTEFFSKGSWKDNPILIQITPKHQF